MGGAVAALVSLLRMFGVDISDLAPSLTDQVLNLAGLIGGIMAIVGRLRARKAIKGTEVAATGGLLPLLVALLVISALLVSGCATTSGNAAADARGRATNAALGEAARVLGSIAVSTLFNAAKQEASGGKVDFASAASAGLWSNAGTIVSSGAVERIVEAYSGGKLPKTAEIAGDVFVSASGSNAAAANAIAAVISSAAGAPPSVQ